MTTFTKLPEGEKPLIEVDAGKKLAKIDDMIYGGFTEYVPRSSRTHSHLGWMARPHLLSRIDKHFQSK